MCCRGNDWRWVVGGAFLVVLAGCAPPTPWVWTEAVKAVALNHDPGANAHYPQLLSYQGALYATWFEDDGGVSQIRVAQADPSRTGTWRFLDGDGPRGLNADTSQPALWSRLVGNGGRLYLSWYEHHADATTSIRIATTEVAPSPTTWIRIEGAKAGLRYHPQGQADFPALETFSDRLYAAWREGEPGGGYEVRVAVFGGDLVHPRWTFVDGGPLGGVNRIRGEEGYYPKLLTFHGSLFLIWYELNGRYRTIRCARYNGDDRAPAWIPVDGDSPDGLNFNPRQDAHGPQLLVVDDALYGLWYERGVDLTGHVRAARFDETRTSWSFVDGGRPGGLNREALADGWWPRGAASGPNLTVAWAERSGDTYKIRVSNLETKTQTWSVADGGQGLGGEGGAAEYPHLVHHRDSLSLAFSERSNGVLRVRVLTAPAPSFP